jgi:hypothetical protein
MGQNRGGRRLEKLRQNGMYQFGIANHPVYLHTDYCEYWISPRPVECQISIYRPNPHLSGSV